MRAPRKIYYRFEQTDGKTKITLYTSKGKTISKGFPFRSFDSAESFLSGYLSGGKFVLIPKN